MGESVCADQSARSDLRLPAWWERVSKRTERNTGPPSHVHPELPTRHPVNINPRNGTHLSKVSVSYSPLCPDIPRTGRQVNSDRSLCLSIHVDLPAARSNWESVPSNCALSRRWSLDALLLMSTPSRCDSQTRPIGAQQPPPFCSKGSPLHDFKATVSRADPPQTHHTASE